MFVKKSQITPLRYEADTLVQVFEGASQAFNDLPAFASRLPDGNYRFTSYRELYEMGLNLATSMIERGVRPREHIGILADNRLEWIIADYATLMCGSADVPRGTDITEDEIVYIITHGDVQWVFAENQVVLNKLKRVQDRLPSMLQIVVMDRDTAAPEGALHLHDLLEEGKALREAGDNRAEERIRQVKPDDLFTVIYTSGTTGTPKGVMLTHANMVSQLKNVTWEIFIHDRMLSILPIWHSYERVCAMLALSRGACTYYTHIRTVAQDMKSVKPTMMASAPRLWESVYGKIMKNVEDMSPTKRKLFNAAYFCSRMFQGSFFFISARQIDIEGRSAAQNAVLAAGHSLRALVFVLPYLLLDKLVLAKLRQVVGGCFRGTVSGGGALPPYVDEFFNYIGLPVLEGYGMTETCPVAAVRTNEKLIIGTVGPLVIGTEARIVDLESGEILYPNPKYKGEGRGRKGELHVKGPQVMRGYYKQPEETARVLKEGWMNTGDIAMITFNDCLKILGRSKETIVLLSGENVEPGPIEDKLKESPMVDTCMVVGNDEKHLAALIVPSLEHFKNNGHGKINTIGELVESSDVQQTLLKEAKTLVSAENGFKAFERLAGITLLPKNFEVGDELTRTFKLKRHVIRERYKDRIAGLFDKSKSG